MKRIDLFVIDGQNDFCDPTGSLYVTGADSEAVLLAAMIDRLQDRKVHGGHKISKIHATLDSHQLMDCAHNTSWKQQDGTCPPPFTIVTPDDVKNHKYMPRFAVGVWEGQTIPSYQWALKYTAALATNGRAPLCLWPPHCQIGSWGQCVYPVLHEAYNNWCKTTSGWIDYITKGDFPFTEHYSAMKADVPDPTVPNTQMNVNVIQDAANADIVLWAGWAGSHCLRYTALDSGNFFGSGENEFLKKSVFLTDASAAVPDIPGAPFKFSEWRKEFLDEVVSRGATLSTTKDFLS